MRMSLCCCGTLDGCTQCRIPSDLSLANITLNFPTAVSTGITTGTATISRSDSGSTGFGGALWTSSEDEDQEQFIAPAIPETLQLRQRGYKAPSVLETGLGYDPAINSVCQWLWNDAVVSEWDYHPSVYDVNDGGSHAARYWLHAHVPQVLDLVRAYTPLNASDSTNPWERVIDSFSGSTTGCSITPTPSCYAWYNGGFVPVWTDYRTILHSYARLTVVAGQWVLTLYSSANRTSVVSGSVEVAAGGATFPEAYTINTGRAFPPGVQAIGTATIGGWNNNISGSGSTSGQAVTIASCTFKKNIDCSSDFDGLPITLSFYEHLYAGSGPDKFQMSSVPSTVELVLDWPV